MERLYYAQKAYAMHTESKYEYIDVRQIISRQEVWLELEKDILY